MGHGEPWALPSMPGPNRLSRYYRNEPRIYAVLRTPKLHTHEQPACVMWGNSKAGLPAVPHISIKYAPHKQIRTGESHVGWSAIRPKPLVVGRAFGRQALSTTTFSPDTLINSGRTRYPFLPGTSTRFPAADQYLHYAGRPVVNFSMCSALPVCWARRAFFLQQVGTYNY